MIVSCTRIFASKLLETHNRPGEPSLSVPGTDKRLAAVAIGHGSFNYTCEGAEAANGPVFVEQFTDLYDALPLFLDGFDEDKFHTLIQAMYEHDYPTLKNTSLECTGSIGTFNGTAVVILSEIDTFEATIVETVPAPDYPEANGLWAHSRSLDDDWEMYRIEMVGGLVPSTCEGLDSSFDIPYAAGYWFYSS